MRLSKVFAKRLEKNQEVLLSILKKQSIIYWNYKQTEKLDVKLNPRQESKT